MANSQLPKSIESADQKVQDVYTNTLFKAYQDKLKREKHGRGPTQRFAAKRFSEFFVLLDKNEGNIVVSCREMSPPISYQSAKHAMRTIPDFNRVAQFLRQMGDEMRLGHLEDISRTQAEEPKNVAERMFQLKALDPSRYRDVYKGPMPNIEINIHSVPPPERFKKAEEWRRKRDLEVGETQEAEFTE